MVPKPVLRKFGLKHSEHIHFLVKLKGIISTFGIISNAEGNITTCKFLSQICFSFYYCMFKLNHAEYLNQSCMLQCLK